MLDKIIHQKRMELAATKGTLPDSYGFDSEMEVPSFSAVLMRPAINIIAEIKYKSPSHGPFRCQLPPEEIAESYGVNGAAALSILTDQAFFSGSLDYLARVRKLFLSEDRLQSLPLLRKDFIIDKQQVLETRHCGASAFLLIVACLELPQLQMLIECGLQEGLDALIEVHDPYELDIAIEAGARIIGVNNRNLKTFQVDIQTSFDLVRRLEGEEFLKVVES